MSMFSLPFPPLSHKHPWPWVIGQRSTVSATDDQLARLRQEIDALDDALLDHVMRRVELVNGVVAAKRAAGTIGHYLRPGREAAILRRLARANTSAFPTPALIRLWRELLCAMLPVQGAFSVVVGGNTIPLWDTARDFYGSDTRMNSVADGVAAMAAVRDGENEVAVVAADDETLIRALMAPSEQPISIVAFLPFVAMRPETGQRCPAFVLSRHRPEESGEDRTVLVFDADPTDALGDTARHVATWRFCSSTASPSPPPPQLLLMMVSPPMPDSARVRIRCSGFPDSPNPPTIIEAPSRRSCRASMAPP